MHTKRESALTQKQCTNPVHSATHHPAVLVLHPALAPYRVDTFNAMAELADFSLLLIKDNVNTQTFDQKSLVKQLTFHPRYLSARHKIFGKKTPLISYNEIMSYKPNIVITSEFSPTTMMMILYKYLSGRRFSTVIWTDDNPSTITNDRRVRKLARHLLTRFSDGWIFASEEARELYQEKFGARGAFAVVPIIRQENEFVAQLNDVGDTAAGFIREYGLEGRRVVLFVGRLVTEKGVDLLLHAFAQARTGIKDAVLVLVGDGQERDSLAALASTLDISDHVKFVGRFEGAALLAWYRVGQVFALGSRHEPFGAVVNEALLAGLPTIVSEHAGAKSLVRPNVNGDIVCPEDTPEFAAAISKWLSQAPPVVPGAALLGSRMQVSFDSCKQQLKGLFEGLLVSAQRKKVSG